MSVYLSVCLLLCVCARVYVYVCLSLCVCVFYTWLWMYANVSKSYIYTSVQLYLYVNDEVIKVMLQRFHLLNAMIHADPSLYLIFRLHTHAMDSYTHICR